MSKRINLFESGESHLLTYSFISFVLLVDSEWNIVSVKIPLLYKSESSHSRALNVQTVRSIDIENFSSATKMHFENLI